MQKHPEPSRARGQGPKRQIRQKEFEAARELWTMDLQANSKGLALVLVSHTKPAAIFLGVGRAGKR